MKSGIAYILAWILFWLGDWLSYPIFYIDILGYLYPVYNKLMCWSFSVQMWGGNNSPWLIPTKINPFQCEYWRDE